MTPYLKNSSLFHKQLDEIFTSLVDFKKEHEIFFNDEIRGLIIKTAHVITYAFSNKNKNELTYIQSLKLALNSNQ